MRASIAIPTIFTPKEIRGHHLIDGGVLNPLPIAPTVSDTTDMTIAVSLNVQTSKNYKVEIPKIEDEKKTKIQEIFFKISQKSEKLLSKDPINKYDNMRMFDIMGKSIDIMQNAVLECKMAGYAPDLIIRIPNNACGFYEFNRAYEMIELGRIIAKDQINTEV